MKREEYLKNALESLSNGRISADAYDCIVVNMGAFVDDDDNEDETESFTDGLQDWYKRWYPDDDLGEDIANISFYDLFDLLDARKDVYPYLANDSLIRERIFKHLAELMECDYSYIYEQWLLSVE